jgi:homoserine dehydrogenase
LLAHVQGSQNMVIATGEFVGKIVLSGYGAGGDPTAVAVISDLYAILRTGGVPPAGKDGKIETPRTVTAELNVPHYLRLIVRDRPGIVAEVAAVLSKHHVGIDAILQKPGYPRSALPFTVTLEACSSAVLDRAFAEIADLDFHVEPPVCLPILPV